MKFTIVTPSHLKNAFLDDLYKSIKAQTYKNWEWILFLNGVFQYCTPEDALVYHYDSQKWAAMIFLTPDAAVQTGTSFYRHKETGIKVAEDPDADRAFAGGFYDATKFELIDTVGNVFNRCVIFDARSIHAATEYFGKTIEDSRLFHIFFFD